MTNSHIKTFRFLDFPVYQAGQELYAYIVHITKHFPAIHRELGDQLRRAALSICLNIAEGSGKYSDKEFNRYLENALGSVNECAACIDITKKQALVVENEYHEGVTMVESIAKQLGGLSKKLRSSKR